MVAPFIPIAKPPIWSLLDNYSIGPDSGTPTKVDSTSVAPNGHIPGKDFASTAPEQNDWQFLASHIVGFVFDSLATSASQDGADDRRVMITDDKGFIDLTGIRLRGSNSVVSPSLLIDNSPAGAPAIDVTTNNGDDPGLLITPGSLGTDGWLAEFIADGNADASGLNIELGDPSTAGLRVLIDNASNAGAGNAIIAQGGDGDISNPAGVGVLGIAGKSGGGGLGYGGFFATQDNETSALTAVSDGTAQDQVPTADFSALNNGDGMRGTCVDGYAGVFRALGDGAPLRIVPRTSDPSGGSSDLAGGTWIVNNIGAGDQHDLRVQLGPGSSDERWMASYDAQHVRAIGSFPGPFQNDGVSTTVIGNFSFLAGQVPQETNIFLLISISFTCERLVDSVNGDDSFMALMELIDNDAAATALSRTFGQASHFTEIGSPSAGTAITWGDRRQSNLEQYIHMRGLYSMPGSGVGDFQLQFAAGVQVIGDLRIKDVIVEIETAF